MTTGCTHWYHRGDAVVAEVARSLDEIGEEDAMLRRVLATVSSPTSSSTRPARAAELGDAAWRAMVERHHAVVRPIIGRYGGTEVDTAGDGFFATFDGPGRGGRSGPGDRQRGPGRGPGGTPASTRGNASSSTGSPAAWRSTSVPASVLSRAHRRCSCQTR